VCKSIIFFLPTHFSLVAIIPIGQHPSKGPAVSDLSFHLPFALACNSLDVISNILGVI